MGPTMMPSIRGDLQHPLPPLHLLEVTIISAQDLFATVKSSMSTYAVAWMDPTHKPRTTVDATGHADPTWNDKLVFRLDDEALKSDTISINIDIFSVRARFHPGSDIMLGTARALISTLHPTKTVKYVALQVRRPSSLRPQGILNIGVALANGYAKSMPLVGGKGNMAVDKGMLDRNRSVTEMERKLERWRVELPTVKDERESIYEEEERGERPRFGNVRSRRTAGKQSWFGTPGEGRGRGEGYMLER